MQNFPSSLSSAVPTNNQKQLQTIVDNLNKMRAEQRTMSQKLSEIEADATEHRLVVDALKEVDMDRTCYHFVGGILIQQTVKEVLPQVEKNLNMLKETVVKFQENVKTKGVEISEYIQKHDLAHLIRTQNSPKNDDDENKKENSQNVKSDSAKSVLVE